jgi:transposase
MEDVLDLYAEPYDPKFPTICFDELPYQMVAETRTALPAKPGRAVRYDYEYQRNGTCNLFMHFQPLAGWRKVKVTQRRTKHDFAYRMKELVDVDFPEAEKIRLVVDNLNTHSPAALYETFEPAEARRITRKLEFHYTPKHGSWLNMAEIELSVLEQQCLDRRLADIDNVCSETAAWQLQRNQQHATVDWQFTTAKARIKLQRLYPSKP